MHEPKALNSSANSPQCKPGFCKVFFAPWLGVIRPSAAADILEQSSRFTFWTTFAFWAYFLAGVMVILALWGGTVTHTFVPDPINGQFINEVHTRTIAQVWHDWHLVDTVTAAEIKFLFTPLIILLLATTLAWFLLPTQPSAIPIVNWVKRAIRRISACGGVLILTVSMINITVTVIRLYNVELPPIILIVYAEFFLIGPWTLIFYAALTLKDTNKVACATLSTPICEDCGYNLLHQPIEGKCPECGSSIAQSVTSGARRNPLQWPPNERIRTWLRTSTTALFNLKEFYNHLEIYGPAKSAMTFAVGHYFGIAICSAIWIAIEIPKTETPATIATASAMAMFIFPLLGWVTHRFVGALSATLWLMRGELPNPQVLPKAFYYETPFLWVFCAYNGIIVTSVINNNWLFKWIGMTGLFNMPIEAFAVLAGNGLLVLIWLLRFGRVLRAVRWANF